VEEFIVGILRGCANGAERISMGKPEETSFGLSKRAL
jgi:hypothetical protein